MESVSRFMKPDDVEIVVAPVTIEGCPHPFLISSMNTDVAEVHVEEGKKLLERERQGENVNKEWNQRARSTVIMSLNQASSNGNEWNDENIKKLRIPVINALFLKVIELSGLRADAAGELKAVTGSPSAKSAAA